MNTRFAVAALSLLTVLSASALELNEAPAGAGEWGYHPEAETSADRNPPGFTWRPTDGAETYTLEIATDEAFTEVVYSKEDHPWTAHCPSEALPEGELYWRYRAGGADGETSDWSQVRPFTMPEDAAAFPMPDRATQAELLPDEHPRLFMRPEDLDGLRELADGALADRMEDLIEEAEALLADPPDTSEPPAYPDGVERLSDEWREIWWGNRERAIAVADGAATLGFVYRLTGESRYADGGRDLLLAVADWDPDGPTSYSYNSEAAMPILYMASRAYSWLHPHLSDDERGAVQAAMAARGEECFNHLSQHLWRPYGSHRGRAWHFLGELAIAFHGTIPESETWLDYAMTIFYTVYPAWGGADGGWHEGSVYWNSYMARFLFWADAMDAAFGIDVYERPFFNQTGYYLMYSNPPGSRHGGFGDQTPGRRSEQFGRLMLLLALGAENPHWLWYADTVGGDIGGGYLGFLRAARLDGIDLEPQAPTDLPGSRYFEDVGLAFLNTNLLDSEDNVQIHFKSSPYGTQSHGYNANNSFLLHLRGEQVLRRSGRRDLYGTPHHQDWMWHTKSDNAITVNGEGQGKRVADAIGQITHFHTSPNVDVVAGEAGDAYENLDRWTRRIVFLKPGVIVIHDLVEAPEPSRYQWMLHAPDEFDIDENAVQWTGDAGSLDIRFLTPDELAFSQVDEPDPPPHEWVSWELNEWHLTAETVEDSETAEFLTVVLVDGAEPELNVEADRGGRRLTIGFEEVEEAILQFGNREFEVQWKDVSESFGDEGAE